MSEGGVSLIRTMIVIVTLSIAGVTLHSQDGVAALDGFTPTGQSYMIDDYTAWHKFRVFATAIARPSRLSDLRAAYAIPGSEYIISPEFDASRFAQDLAEMNAVVGTYGEGDDIFFPFTPSDYNDCNAQCWGQALQQLRLSNSTDPWYILRFDRAISYLSDDLREVIVDTNNIRW